MRSRKFIMEQRTLKAHIALILVLSPSKERKVHATRVE